MIVYKMIGLGKKVLGAGKGLGKKAIGAGSSIAKKVVKVATTAAVVAGTALKVHSALTDQSVSDSFVDAKETAKDLKETAIDVNKAQKAKADVEKVMDDSKETKLQKAKAVKNIAKGLAKDKEERNKKRQENREEKPKDIAIRERAEAKAKADKEKAMKDAKDRAMVGTSMKNAEVKMKRENCYKKTKSGKKGRLNLIGKDKKKCDNKFKF